MNDISKSELGEIIWLMLTHLEDAEAKHSDNWVHTYNLQQRVSLIAEELGELAKEVNDLDAYMRSLDGTDDNAETNAWHTICNITEESYQLLAVVFRFVLIWRDEQNTMRSVVRDREKKKPTQTTEEE